MFNTSSCRGNWWNPVDMSMLNPWIYVRTVTSNWIIIHANKSIRLKFKLLWEQIWFFRRCCHWICRQCPRCFSLFFTSFKELIIICTSRKERDILGSPQELINRFLARPLILSDGAYPPTAWQVRPYSFNLNLSDTEKSSNKHLSLARVTVKRAFGVLKRRWRYLLKRLDNDLESVSSIIITCCVLYNICQQSHDN